MKVFIKNIVLVSALFLSYYTVYAQTENPVIASIKKEVDRNMSNLKMEGMPTPFFISYSVIDLQICNLSASLGSISSFYEIHQRRGMPNLLVGNYHRNNLKLAGRYMNQYVTSLHDNTTGIPITIWKELDASYKDAVEKYQAKIAILQQRTQTEEENKLPDLEQVKPVDMIQSPVSFTFNKAYWENYLRKASEIAQQYPEILSSNVSLNVRNATTYTYNTEGSRYTFPHTFYELTFTASTRSYDGQDLTYTLYRENSTFEQMPDLATFSNECKWVMNNLLELKNAPVVDDAYSGPVLFEGQALLGLLAQVFLSNNKLVAAPQLVQAQGQGSQFGSGPSGGNDFELMLNKKVISRDLSLISITGQEFYKGQRLNGYYPIDAEGVAPAKEMMLIENGVLRNLLNGRVPTNKFQHSNGHVRYDYNSYANRTLPGNLLITGKQTFSYDDLRKKLIEAALEEDLEYAYVVKEMGGGAPFIYKVYVADGREELVRGATITDGASLRPFKRILGVSDKEQMKNYGQIPTTVISPTAMLFEEMDVTRMQNIEFKKPYIVAKP